VLRVTLMLGSFRRILLALVCVAAAIGCLFAYGIHREAPPTDAMLVEKFHSHQGEYERLREMLRTDTTLVEVYTRSGVQARESGAVLEPSHAGMVSDRYAEYRRLLGIVSATSVLRRDEYGSGTICINVWNSGFGGNTRHVQVCSLEQPPRAQVASLDDFYRSPTPRQPVFRHLKSAWYLWADR
jgi:hypothetical protein